MKKTDLESSNTMADFPIPTWLTEILGESGDYLVFSQFEVDENDKAFKRRCREGANLALSLSSLRKERERIGFVPLALGAYLQGLFKVADVSVGPILSWIGIDDPSKLSSASPISLARLARGIGIELRQALIHLRISFAEHIDGAPMALLVARQRSTSPVRNSLEECEAVLGEVELDYDLESLKLLRRAEFEFRSAYKEEARLGA